MSDRERLSAIRRIATLLASEHMRDDPLHIERLLRHLHSLPLSPTERILVGDSARAILKVMGRSVP